MSACATDLLGQHVKYGSVVADLCSDGTNSGTLCPEGQNSECPSLSADAVCYAGGEHLMTFSPLTYKVLYSLLLAFTQHARHVESPILGGAALNSYISMSNSPYLTVYLEVETHVDPTLLHSSLRIHCPTHQAKSNPTSALLDTASP